MGQWLQFVSSFNEPCHVRRPVASLLVVIALTRGCIQSEHEMFLPQTLSELLNHINLDASVDDPLLDG